MAQRAEWLRSRGFGNVTLTARGELFVHDWDDETGSFYGSVNFDAFASLLRRPVSEAPWEEAETVNAPHTYRWSDGQWEWLYAPNHPVSDAELAELKTALARTT